ncbi:SusC/RagA family TonB-linked outer membrane protein [Flavobacterium sp.]|uniref:SusC/RagA family TonB-linked outer membrane protein n=1 Tax=Flavobacterium sp. TaxID=239 RepID=UPI00391D7FF1
MRSKFKWIFTLLLAFTMQFSFAQEKTVTGTVSDGKVSLPMANVVIKGTKNGVQTDMDGKFSIKAKQGDVLVVSYQGYDTNEVKITTANTYKVTLVEESKVLDEVVVQGYRSVAKRNAVTAVQTVNSKTIENRPNANVLNTLQGQVAGVNISTGSGQPGAKPTVIIRGLSTVTGNSDPLYVIDGFPSNSDNFRSLNPNDIASMDVLKDASAIAEFGARGSNGVIVIKTRRGVYGEGKTSFRYTSTVGLTELQTPRYDYSSARELLKIQQNFGQGRGSTLTDAEISAYNIDTDWVDYFFRIGASYSHNLAIENSAKNVNAFTSVNYFEQEGVLKTTGLKRFTMRNNLSGKSNNEKFKYFIGTAVGFSKNNEATNLGSGAVNQNYVLGAYTAAPFISPREYNGNSFDLYTLYANDGTLLYTPLFLIDKLQKFYNLTDETKINLATDYSYKLSKNLTLRGKTSAEVLLTRFTQSTFPDSFNALLFSSTQGVPSTQGGNFNGTETINQSRTFLFNQLYQLDYEKTFGKHTISAVASAEYNQANLHSNNFTQRGLDPRTFVPNTGAGYIADVGVNDFYVPSVSAVQLRSILMSYFGSLDYDYDGKYGLVGTLRQDSTNRFENTTEVFWSAGARWNIDAEPFMKGAKNFIDMLKLRGSVGTVGNQRIIDGSVFAGLNPPRNRDIYSNVNNVYNGQIGYGINFGYDDLRWETTRQYNIGVDFEMFKKRLRGTFDYYNRKTFDLYLTQAVTNSSGTTSLLRNSDAFVVNKGVELNLAYDIFRKQDMTLTARIVGSYNDNTIDGIKQNNGRLVNPDGVTINQNGGPIDQYFLYPYVGVNQTNGELLFLDASNNITEDPLQNADQRATNKNRLPLYQGSFGFDFDYKGFFTSATFTYAFDVWRFDYDYESLLDPGSISQFNVSPELLNAWTPTNTNTNVPALNASNLGADDFSDRFLRDASYVRLRNLQIGYRIPKKLIEKTFIKDASIMAQGENLFNITNWKGFDPESDRDFDFNNYPTPRIYTITLDLKF